MIPVFVGAQTPTAPPTISPLLPSHPLTLSPCLAFAPPTIHPSWLLHLVLVHKAAYDASHPVPTSVLNSPPSHAPPSTPPSHNSSASDLSSEFTLFIYKMPTSSSKKHVAVCEQEGSNSLSSILEISMPKYSRSSRLHAGTMSQTLRRSQL